MEIRNAGPADLDAIMDVYHRAREFMRRSGNLTQWADGYPGRELISQDYVGEFFDVPYLLDLLDQHYSGKVKTHRKLYTVLSFLIWYQVYFPEKCGVEPFRP